MAISYVQDLLDGTTGSINTTVSATGSKTVTLGNTIIVAYASDWSMGTLVITDNLGNNYVEFAGSSTTALSLQVRLFAAFVEFAGTLTSITGVQGVNTAAKSITSMEMSPVTPSASSENHSTGSTSPSGTTNPANGLHLWALGIATDGLGTVTMPTGYTLGCDARQGGGDGILVGYKIGTESGGTATGSISISEGWIVMTESMLELATRPALAGISMDGVTIR